MAATRWKDVGGLYRSKESASHAANGKLNAADLVAVGMEALALGVTDIFFMVKKNDKKKDNHPDFRAVFAIKKEEEQERERVPGEDDDAGGGF